MKKTWGSGKAAVMAGLTLGVSPAMAQDAGAADAVPDSYWTDGGQPSEPTATRAPQSDVSTKVAQSDPAPSPPPEPAVEPAPSSDVSAQPDTGAAAPEAAETVVAEEAQSTDSFASAEPDPEPVAESGWLSGVNFDWGGFIRTETAISTTSRENPNNNQTNVFNNRSIARQAYTPPALLAPVPATWSTLPVPVVLATDASSPAVREARTDDSIFNYGILRGELEGAVNLTSELKIIGRLRGIYDLNLASNFNGSHYDELRGGISGGVPELYRGKVNELGYRVDGSSNPNPLEWSGKDYQLYFPALFLQYNRGALDVRIGNQQIAWGQAIFFRVLDIPDGLDLRRHSVLDYAQEEFSDKRVPALGIRVSYQLTDDILADGYVQKFQPTIFGNPNTSYNVIPSQFTVHDRYSEGGYDNKVSYGIRMKANVDQYGIQLVAARRYNPEGVFRWTESGVNRDLPNNLLSLGALVNTAYAVYPGRMYGSTGEALSHTPFEVAPTGVYSADEWFYYAANTRLNGLEGLNSVVNEFEAARDLFATPVDNTTDAAHLLNTFFIGGGGSLRGHLAREYFAENNFGLGLSYIVDGEPGSLLDQLIINVETLYTPNRHYTNPSLSRNYLEDDSSVSALVLEKYHRFSDAFPATYIVMQYMYRNADDLVGRSLKGYGGGGVDGTGNPTIASGVGNAQYLALAFQQPLPQDIYRFGFAALYDPRGGILLQPGVKWKPRGDFTVEAFYSYLNGNLRGGGDVSRNKNVISSLDFADEFSLRLSYQF